MQTQFSKRRTTVNAVRHNEEFVLGIEGGNGRPAENGNGQPCMHEKKVWNEEGQ